MKLKKYETIYVSRADITEDKQKQLFNRLDAIVAEQGGRMLRVDDWGVRKTAYPIQKHGKAHYMQLTYAGVPGVVAQVERILRMLDEIMKFFSLKIADEVSSEEMAQELVRTVSRREETDRFDRRNRRDDRRRDDEDRPLGLGFEDDEDELDDDMDDEDDRLMG